jgi:hypothetical protein
MIVGRGGARADGVGQAQQRIIRRRPVGVDRRGCRVRRAVFGLDILALVQVVAGDGAGHFADASALVVVGVRLGGHAGLGDLGGAVEAVQRQAGDGRPVQSVAVRVTVPPTQRLVRLPLASSTLASSKAPVGLPVLASSSWWAASKTNAVVAVTGVPTVCWVRLLTGL